MKTPLLRTILWLVLVLPQAATAQMTRHCGTDLHHARLQSADPAFARWEEELERDYQAWLADGPAARGRSTIVIPVVVHVIQYSAFQAISDERIRSQIEVLNEDFRLLNSDTAGIPAEFKPFAADTEIEFCLASIDPVGCPTNGIVRVVAPDLADHAIGQSGQLKGLSQWDPSRYLNIWVPVSIADNILGYATFPGTLLSNPAEDGVVINGHYMGRGHGIAPSAFSLGRTGTHEVGHWLGLYHTFQGGCNGASPSNCATAGDRVCDTPPTASPNYGCPSTKNTCTETPTDHNDMLVNYMDYGDDACLLMFSQGQKDRMGFFLNGTRSNIWSAANLTSTGCDGTPAPGCYPIAEFTASSYSICAGDSIWFTDLSTGPPTTIAWAFQGGSPASSAASNPVVSFAQPGLYTVNLAVFNSYGMDIKSVQVEVLAAVLPPLSQGFEAASLPAGWYVRDEDQAGSWERTDTAFTEGSHAMVTRNYIRRQKGTRDELVTPLYDLSTATGAQLVFDYAYKRRDAFSPDTLNIWVTTDCGRTWERVWNKGGMALATTPGLAIPAEFVPTASQWKTDTIDLAGYLGAAGLRVKFQCVGRYGQSLYLDRVNLAAELPTSVKREEQSPDLRIVPNPFREVPEVVLELGKGGAVSWQLIDAQGRVMDSRQEVMYAPGRQLMEFDRVVWGKLPAGLYIITVKVSGTTTSRKLIKL